MAVGALEALGIVFGVGQWLVSTFENVDWVLFGGLDIVVFVLGFLSAAIDNVPLVAASMGMFGEAIDNPLWHGIAYAAGTGGSMVIIGSAAGVVAMGMEKIDFCQNFFGQFGQKYLDYLVQIHTNIVRNETIGFLVTICFSYGPLKPLILQKNGEIFFLKKILH